MTETDKFETSRRMSRRDVGRLLVGAAVATAVLPSTKTLAAKRFQVGEAELEVISDGYLELPAAFSFPRTPEAERDAALLANKFARDLMKLDCNVTLLKRGERTVLFDVGAGPSFVEGAGNLLAHLRDAGISPASVTDVVFTHGHPDHLWGLTDDFDELVFPEATYRMGEVEWNYWQGSDTLSKSPEERKAFVVGAQKRLRLIEDRVQLFKAGTEVLPGVEAIATHGHTPGHMSFMLHGGSEPMLITGDVLLSAISFTNPDWHCGTDHDPATGSETRKRLLERIVAEKVKLIGYHLPYPGEGSAKAEGATFRFVPST